MLLMVITPSISAMESPSDSPNETSVVSISRKADFRTALNVVSIHEGYYNYDPHDKGGETYAGITRRWNRKWYGWKHIDAHKKINKVKWLARNYHIAELDHWVLDYYLTIWINESFDHINSQVIANYLFDLRVNTGRFATVAQNAVNHLGDSVTVDGRIGSATINAINNADSLALLSTLVIARQKIYRRIVANDRNQQRYLQHWLQRSASPI
jgi:lysozyme family protein